MGCQPPPTIFVGAKRFKVDTLYLDDFLSSGSPDTPGPSNRMLSSTLAGKCSLIPELLGLNGSRDFRLSAGSVRSVRSAVSKFDREALMVASGKQKRSRGRKGVEPMIMEVSFGTLD